MTASSHRVRQSQHNIQCLYNLDRRVHAVQAYPILSPQGASIVLYGHENGVTILWRGGRRLKEAATTTNEKKDAAPQSKPAANKNDDAVMVLDSDSDDENTAPSAAATAAATTATFVDRPIFDEVGPANATIEGGFLDVVQSLDLALGTAVHSIAVLPLAPCAATDAEPRLLQTQMVFAVTCAATADVYVVTLPLTPPSHASKARPQLRANLLGAHAGRGAFGELLIPLGGPSRSSEVIAMTLVKQTSASAAAASASASTAKSTSSRSAPPPIRVVVATHAREASGTLRLWDVAVPATTTTLRGSNAASLSSLDRPLEPFQTEYLPSPLTGLAFNLTHPTQLLVVDPRHAVRIYDYTVPAIPSDDPGGEETPFPSQGSWLLSLYPPFVRSAGSGGVTSPRKPIVAAAWVAYGHAILALLADGQWGVWDIDCTAASSSSSTSGSSLFAGRSGMSGVRGAALTAFNLSGHIEGTTPLRNPVVAGARKSADGDFVPMTPHTRRDVLAAAFGGSGSGSGGGGGYGGSAERLAGVRGGVVVVQQRAGRGSASGGSESAVLWLGGADYTVAVIPDVARFWEAQLRRGSGGGGGGMNLFSGARPTRMMRLADLNASLLGERCCGVSVAVRSTVHDRDGDDDKDTEGTNDGDGDGDDDEEEGPLSRASWDDRAPIEILVQGESRLVVVRETSDEAFSGALASRLQAAAAAPSLSSRKRKGLTGTGGSSGGGDTVSSALVVEPRPRKAGTVTFDPKQKQPFTSGGSLWGPPDEAAASAQQQQHPPTTPSAVRHRRAPLTKTLFETPGQPAPGIDALTPRDGNSRQGAQTGTAAQQQRALLFDENEVTLTMSMRKPPASWRQRQQQQQEAPPALPDTGLTFAGDLEEAANAEDDEEAADDRNIEEEMLDIMEIDRALEAMEENRDSGAENVFFEGV